MFLNSSRSIFIEINNNICISSSQHSHNRGPCCSVSSSFGHRCDSAFRLHSDRSLCRGFLPSRNNLHLSTRGDDSIMRRTTSRSMMYIIGMSVALSMVAAFALIYSNTGIGGSNISIYASNTSTQQNTLLPYLLAILVTGLVFGAFASRRR